MYLAQLTPSESVQLTSGSEAVRKSKDIPTYKFYHNLKETQSEKTDTKEGEVNWDDLIKYLFPCNKPSWGWLCWWTNMVEEEEDNDDDDEEEEEEDVSHALSDPGSPSLTPMGSWW